MVRSQRVRLAPIIALADLRRSVRRKVLWLAPPPGAELRILRLPVPRSNGGRRPGGGPAIA